MIRRFSFVFRDQSLGLGNMRPRILSVQENARVLGGHSELRIAGKALRGAGPMERRNTYNL
jgi:hypothetical protein